MQKYFSVVRVIKEGSRTTQHMLDVDPMLDCCRADVEDDGITSTSCAFWEPLKHTTT